jgi:hypothetical protein
MKFNHSYSALKQFEQCPLRYYRQRILKDIKDSMGEAGIHGIKVHEALEARVKDGTPLPKHLSKMEPTCAFLSGQADMVQVEREMTLNDKLEPTGWFDRDAWLRGKLDVLLIKGKHALVLDWKTGKRRPDMFQLELFAGLVFRHYPEVEQVTTTLIWTKTHEVDTEVFPRSEYNNIFAKVLGKINRIHDAYENEKWPAHPSGLCNYCPAKHDCAYAD